MSDPRSPALTSVPGMVGRGPGLGPGMRGGVKVRPAQPARGPWPGSGRIFAVSARGLPSCSLSSWWILPWGWRDRT